MNPVFLSPPVLPRRGRLRSLVPLAFGALGSAFGLLPVFWANGAFLLTGGFVSLAERRVSAARDGAAALAEQQEEDT